MYDLEIAESSNRKEGKCSSERSREVRWEMAVIARCASLSSAALLAYLIFPAHPAQSSPAALFVWPLNRFLGLWWDFPLFSGCSLWRLSSCPQKGDTYSGLCCKLPHQLNSYMQSWTVAFIEQLRNPRSDKQKPEGYKWNFSLRRVFNSYVICQVRVPASKSPHEIWLTTTIYYLHWWLSSNVSPEKHKYCNNIPAEACIWPYDCPAAACVLYWIKEKATLFLAHCFSTQHAVSYCDFRCIIDYTLGYLWLYVWK